PPRSALGMGMQALTVLIHQRLSTDVARYESACRLFVAPPLCPLDVSPTDFRRTGELIERAQDQTREWLDAGPPATGQAESIRPHHHD
ncbi:MAG: patatin-like phospholipase family protein, partial [Actinomycetota bacterium]